MRPRGRTLPALAVLPDALIGRRLTGVAAEPNCKCPACSLAEDECVDGYCQPKVPGKLRLNVRERREEPKGSGRFKIVERTLDTELDLLALGAATIAIDTHRQTS